uniref:protein-tyrosine-phosphatase n=1 Tax=Gadus morhua TaxID=8049 RepID=A0A8C5BV79_GADMO
TYTSYFEVHCVKKCERYWPETQAEQFLLSDLDAGADVDHSFAVCSPQCSRALHQLHYYNWPDHGVPDSIPPILEMLQEMRICQDHDDVPIVIHCR